MPELPEVETVRRGLAKSLVGRRFARVTVHEPRLRWPIPAAQKKHLLSEKILNIDRRSKYLLFRLARGTLLSHLGMSGSYWIYERGMAPARRTHDHVEWQFDDDTIVRYNDPRRFGSLHWIALGDEATHPLLAALGPEPLSDAFNPVDFYTALQSRAAPIKSAIMDNHLVVGVGNIYASEALFRASIHPNRPANRISVERVTRLVTVIKDLLQEAIDAGGSTLRDFVNSKGEPGAFQLQYRVYGKKFGETCPICAAGIRMMRHNGRATYYCAKCQR